MSDLDLPILVTRAEPGASETLQRLHDLALNGVQASVLELAPRLNVALPSPLDLAGLIFTSANGVRVYASRSEDRGLTTWCVGPATAAAARQAGFSDIRESIGNAQDLADFILAHSNPESSPLLHVANAAATGQLKRRLEAANRNVVFAALYDMHPIETFAPEIARVLQHKAAGIVLIHSRKGANAFASCTQDMDLRQWIGVAISDQAAVPLDALDLRACFVAEKPTEDGLFVALKNALATLSA